MRMILTMLALLTAANSAFALGTVTVTKSTRTINTKSVRVVKIHWVADVAAATVPNVTISALGGYINKIVTKPGATQPTASYSIAITDNTDAGADGVNGSLASRSASATESVFPQIGTGGVPLLIPPDNYTFKLTGNSVNSASGDVYLYLSDSL